MVSCVVILKSKAWLLQKGVLFPHRVKVRKGSRLNPQLAAMAGVGSLFTSYEEEVGFMRG